MTRLNLAFVVAAIWMPLLVTMTSEDYFRIQAFFLVSLFSVPLTAIVAVPLFKLFREKITLSKCMIVGLAIGLLGTLIFMLMTNFEAALNWAVLLIGSGWVSSVLFYFVGIWRNKDLLHNSPQKYFNKDA